MTRTVTIQNMIHSFGTSPETPLKKPAVKKLARVLVQAAAVKKVPKPGVQYSRRRNVTGPAPDVEIGTPRSPAFAPFIVGFLEVSITANFA